MSKERRKKPRELQVFGRYDLLGPSRDIVLPDRWEPMVQPGWMVELRLRPQPDAVRDSLFPEVSTPKSSSCKGNIPEDRDSGSLHRHRPSLRGRLKSSKSSKSGVLENP